MSQKCNTTILDNGTTKIPVDFEKCFQNKNFSALELPSNVTTDVIYEEITPRTDRWYSVLRFYPNGKVNYFSFPDKTAYTVDSFDPKIQGLRGRLVKSLKDGEDYVQLYTIIASNISWGIKTEAISVVGDEIRITNTSGHTSIFKKKIIPKEFLSYKANW
ncbi:hypothetical protein [Epilithonimonas sp.]|uniref:hypothetical protein n=1 Tax=Epilithonimonas sp. TaxID=2894511 RepID=UPI0028A1194F|nr:hypothetical protein [Epilithonimonas sp.]